MGQNKLDSVLAGLKSAVVVEDPDEVAKILEERYGLAKAAGAKGHTRITRTREGRAEVHKVSAKSLLGDGSPKVDPATYPELAKQRGIPWEVGYEKRVIPYWASHEGVDAHGDIVRQSWIFDLYEGNPVMPLSHDWGGLPVGNSLDWKVLDRVSKDYSGQSLWLLNLFATKEQSARADEVFRLTSAGFLRAGSVGFFSDKLIDVRDADERQMLGLGKHGVVLEENHLMEFSPCTLGANAGAHTVLSAAKARGELSKGDMETARELMRAERRAFGMEDAWIDEDKTIVAMAKLLFPRSKFMAHRALEAPFEAFENETLRGYRPKDGGERQITLESLDQKIDALQESFSEGMVGLATMLEDMKTAASMNEDGDEEDMPTHDTRTALGRALAAREKMNLSEAVTGGNGSPKK